MYLQHLHIENLKRIRSMGLDFTQPDGSSRLWNVIIGPNGTAKTSILQAIALAAAGGADVSRLTAGQEVQMRSAVPGWTGPLKIEARFQPGGENVFTASLSQPEGTTTISVTGDERLSQVRAAAAEPGGWFVGGYGVARSLPAVGSGYRLQRPSIERLEPLFNHRTDLTSTTFVDFFENGSRNQFVKALKSALIKTNLLPGVTNIEIRGRGGVRSTAQLQDRNNFSMLIGGGQVKIPAIGLSHGYQSTIAWIADLVGHLLLAHNQAAEARGEDADKVPFSLAEARGLVLVDELDSYLHPTWQVLLVHALRAAFPRMQFIVSTHSPLLLTALNPVHDQLVDLDFDSTTGEVVHTRPPGDPRLMSGTQLYARYFDLKQTYAGPEGEMLQRYQYLATNPFRSDAEDGEVKRLGRALTRAGITLPLVPIVPRRKP